MAKARPTHNWTLVLLDDITWPRIGPAVTTITGHLPPENVVEQGIGGVYAGINVPGLGAPRTQYVRGEQEFFNFEATFVADPTVDPDFNNEDRDTIKKARRLLKQATRPFPSLNRPPKFFFEVADTSFVCFVENIGSITYGDQSDTVSGLSVFHLAKFSIRLRVLDDFSDYGNYSEASPKWIQPVHRVIEKETYEEVALRRYGDPLLGEALRQQELEAFPESGGVFEVMDGKVAKKLGVAPRSVAMQAQRLDVGSAIESVHVLRNRWAEPGTFGESPQELLPTLTEV